MYHKGKQSVFVVGRLWTLLPPPAKVEALHLFRCCTHKTQQTHTLRYPTRSTLLQYTLHHITLHTLHCAAPALHSTTLRYATLHTHTHPHYGKLASWAPTARMPDMSECMSECMSDKMLDRMQEYIKKTT